jgi:hypothetical protein
VTSRVFAIANLVAFQAVWFAAVIGAANGMPWAGPIAAVVFAAAHFVWTSDRAGDFRLLLIALPMGLAADSLLAATGLLRFDSPWPSEHLAPAWILAMWAGFALTLNHSMAFLRGRWWLSLLFGLIGGPLAYWGAATGFGAVEFGESPAVALAVLAIVWGLALPLLYALQPSATSSALREGSAV